MAKMKERNVCVEVCPISNEILGLTPRISGHSVYNLLANNVPCTISTDNGTFFRCVHIPLTWR
jgi:adenosine deaminase CECR1